MEDFSLNKLWDLRAELDNCILNMEYGRIKEVKAKYQNLVEGERWFSHAFICYNHGFYTEGARGSHNFANVNSILKNIENYERKYLDGEDVSIKLRTQYSTNFLSGEIWTLRAMYDKFLMQASEQNNELQNQQNMILGKAIIDRLTTLLHMEQTEDFGDQIRPILYEVKEGYARVYGKNQPTIEYFQLAEEYLERL